MRLLLPLSGHPKLHKCGEWNSIEQIIHDCSDMAYFYVVVPKGAVLTNGSLPNTTVLRSGVDDNYWFFRDVSEFANINDGKNVVDAAAVSMPEMAAGLDLFCNEQGFKNAPFNLPIVIWHTMFWVLRKNQWRFLCPAHHNLFISDAGKKSYAKFIREHFRPSVAAGFIDAAGVETFVGRPGEISRKAQEVEKYERPTVIYGSRMNEIHNPFLAFEIIEAAYRVGADFDLIVTTPDVKVDKKISDFVEKAGGELHTSCGMDRYQDFLVRSHVSVTTGDAEAPTYVVEGLAARVAVVAERSQFNFSVLDFDPEYPWVFRTADEGKAMLISMLKNLDENRAEIERNGYWDSKIEELDERKCNRRSIMWIRDKVRSFKRRESGGMGGKRALRFARTLSMLDGEATLSEVVAKVESDGVLVRKERIGRWITRKLIHDMLVSNPSITDMCDDAEPRYVMDLDEYRKWVESRKESGDDQDD